jgi:hypothetical protein
MSGNEEYGVGARGKRFDPGEGPQLLAQLRATGGTQVFGSDGEKVGELKEVGDASFVVDRGALRGEVCVLVERVGEVTGDGRIVLDVPADQAAEVG